MFAMDISPSPLRRPSPEHLDSPLHPASLVHPATHSPAILDLIDIKITRPVIDYLVDCVVETVDYAMGRPSTSRGRATFPNPQQAKFTTFVTNVITRAEVSMPTILGTLVYIDRAKPHLHIALEEWAHERVFLGALICASKYLNDSTLKNVHWALCTGVFGKRDVGRIEREFLDVLDFELGVAEHDFLSHHEGLMAISRPHRSHRPSRSFISQQPSSQHPQQSQQPAGPAPAAPSSTSTSSSRPVAVSVAVPRVPVPELSPSSPSPESSPASASPRTPSTLSSSSSSPAHAPPVPAKDVPQPPPLISINPASSMDLRAFGVPIPKQTLHAGHHHRGNHVQYPIRVYA